MKKQISYLLALCMTASCMVVPAVTAQASDERTTIASFEAKDVTSNDANTETSNRYRQNWHHAVKPDTNAKTNVKAAGDTDKKSGNKDYYFEADVAITGTNISSDTAAWTDVIVVLQSKSTSPEERTDNNTLLDHSYITSDSDDANKFHISVPLNTLKQTTQNYKDGVLTRDLMNWDNLNQVMVDVFVLKTYTDVSITITNEKITANADAKTYDYAAKEALNAIETPVNNGSYTEESFTAYANAVDAAQKLATAETSEIEKIQAALTSAEKGLVKVAPANAIKFEDKKDIKSTDTAITTDWLKMDAAIDMSDDARRGDFTLHLKITAKHMITNDDGSVTYDDNVKFSDLVNSVFLRAGNKLNGKDNWSQENNIQNYGTVSNNSIEIEVPLSSNLGNGSAGSNSRPVDWSALDAFYIYANQKDTYKGSVSLDFTEIWLEDSGAHAPATAAAEGTLITNGTDNQAIAYDANVSINGTRTIKAAKWTVNGEDHPVDLEKDNNTDETSTEFTDATVVFGLIAELVKKSDAAPTSDAITEIPKATLTVTFE